MVVCPAGDNTEPALGNSCGHGFRVGHDLFLIFLEGRLHRFLQAHRLCRHRVHQRTALGPGECQLVQFLGKRRLAQDQAAAWPAQRFVRRRRNNVRVRNWARMHAHGHESGDVRHVHKKERANGLRGFGNALEIDDPRISAGTGDDHLWLVRAGELLDFVVVDALVFLFHAVGYELVHPPGEI